MTRNLHVFSAVLLGAIIASCAGEPSASGPVSSVRPTGPIPPYTVQAAELDETSGPRLAKALRAIDGVEDVELDLEARRANVQTRSGLFLYEPQVRAAFSSANVEFASFQPPSEALVTVYVVEAGGGG